MSVDREALWILIAVCCVPSLVLTARARLRPPRRLGAYADTLLTGLGIGLGAATVLLVLAAAWVRLADTLG